MALNRQRVTRKKKNGTVLNVNALSKIPALEKALHSGKINIILVFAEWCGACHRFRKNIWDPMLKNKAIHNRIAVRDDMVGKSSLANTKFDYLPSVLVVDEKGNVQTFKTPEGKDTNAMPTPKNLNDMNRIVNVPVAPMPTEELGTTANSAPNVAVRKNMGRTGQNSMNSNELAESIAQNANYTVPPLRNLPAVAEANMKAFNKKLNDQIMGNEPVLEKDMPMNKEPLELIETKPLATPQGTVYVPVRGAASAAPMKGGGGGALLSFMEALPAALLGSLAVRGGRRTTRKRNSRRRP